MGVLPLQFQEGNSWKTLGIDGTETFDILGINNEVKPGQTLTVVATRTDGTQFEFTVVARLDSMVDVDYYHNGGILQTVLRQMIKESAAN
ncbi:Aconitate hydratase [compost metagenome]